MRARVCVSNNVHFGTALIQRHQSWDFLSELFDQIDLSVISSCSLMKDLMNFEVPVLTSDTIKCVF